MAWPCIGFRQTDTERYGNQPIVLDCASRISVAGRRTAFTQCYRGESLADAVLTRVIRETRDLLESQRGQVRFNDPSGARDERDSPGDTKNEDCARSGSRGIDESYEPDERGNKERDWC